MPGGQKLDRADLRFMPEVERARRDRGPRFAYLLSLLTLLFALAMGFWAEQAALDVVTRARGHVIAATTNEGAADTPGGLVAEALVRESDLAALRPGQSATITLAAYDPSAYGSLTGTLARIGKTAVQGKDGSVYYRITLNIDHSALKQLRSGVQILPGMTVTAEILSGKTTVLDALLRPFLRGAASTRNPG